MASVNVHPSMTQSAPQSNTVREGVFPESSFLQHFRYDASTFQLTVTMKSGAQYVSFYVFPMVVDQWLQAPSKGSFYGQMVKGKHITVRVVHKGVGPQVRNPMKGPIKHERKRV